MPATTSEKATPARLAKLPTWLLGQAAARSHHLLTDALSAVDARGYHYRILAALDEYGPASQAELGRIASLDRSDVNAVIGELVDKGAVTRTPSQADRRQNEITLTRAGQELLKTLDDVIDAVQQRLLTALSADERATLISLLARINR